MPYGLGHLNMDAFYLLNVYMPMNQNLAVDVIVSPSPPSTKYRPSVKAHRLFYLRLSARPAFVEARQRDSRNADSSDPC